MVVVIVAEQHMDARKILPSHARRPRRRGPIAASGLALSDQIGSVSMLRAALLQQHRGMVDQRNSQPAPSTADGGFDGSTRPQRSGRIVPAGWRSSIAKHQTIPAPRRVRIEEALPVKVNRKFCHSTLFHEFPFTHNSQACPSMKVLFQRRGAENAEEAQRTQLRNVFSALPPRSLRLSSSALSLPGHHVHALCPNVSSALNPPPRAAI